MCVQFVDYENLWAVWRRQRREGLLLYLLAIYSWRLLLQPRRVSETFEEEKIVVVEFASHPYTNSDLDLASLRPFALDWMKSQKIDDNLWYPWAGAALYSAIVQKLFEAKDPPRVRVVPIAAKLLSFISSKQLINFDIEKILHHFHISKQISIYQDAFQQTYCPCIDTCTSTCIHFCCSKDDKSRSSIIYKTCSSWSYDAPVAQTFEDDAWLRQDVWRNGWVDGKQPCVVPTSTSFPLACG